MRIKCKLIFALALSALLASCASTSRTSNTPAWFPDYRATFPDSQYIAQRGMADSEQMAKTDAVSQIARYFKTSVNVNLKTSVHIVTDDEIVHETTSVVDDVDVMSQVELFSLETTDPYFFKGDKKWYCVAYIDIEKAWQQYQPDVENAKAEFYSLYQNGMNESDPFTKYVMYKKAAKAGEAFLEKLEFVRALNPQKEAAYADDLKTVSRLRGLIEAEKEKCTVYLSVSGDYGNIISSSLSQTLTKNGFKVAKAAGGAAYTASAIVENNAMGSEPIALYPSLDLKITNKSGKTVYSQEVKVTQKTVSYTMENAQKKAFPILAEEADKEITAEMTEIFGN